MGKRITKDSVHYVDNKKFSEAVADYARACHAAKKAGKPEPQMSSYVGGCILKIAQRQATRPNFSGYSYKEEMISDGVENVIRYLSNFNPDAVTRAGKPNAFGYVSKIIYFAFLRRIDAEKKQQYIKEKNIEMAGIFGEYASHQSHDERQFQSDYAAISSGDLNNLDYVEKKRARKNKIKE